MTKTLGITLQRAREMKGLSLKRTADPAKISPTYLQKLERDEVHEPSPHVLYRLGEQLDLPYSQLLELAGYVVPKPPRAPRMSRRRGPLTHAMSSEPLTDEEAEALAEYLSFLRSRRGGNE